MSLEERIAELAREVARAEVERILGERSGPEVLSTEQAAEVAGVSPKTVREWISAGKLAAGRRGQRRTIRRADLERFLAGEQPEGRTADDLLRRRSA